MGRILLVCRLAARDLRRRKVHAALLLLVITTAMTTLTLGRILQGVTSKPYGQTRAATAGPDVVASSIGYTRLNETSTAALGHLAALAHAPGVSAHSGPYPVAWPVLRANGVTADAMAEGRDRAPASVDQPKVIEGTWVHSGGVVLERSLADAMGVHVGDHVTLGGRPFRVVGVAVTAAVPVFSQMCFFTGGCGGPGGRPASFDTGLVWLTRAAARGLATPGNPLTYYLNLKLSDPGTAPAFVNAHQPPPGDFTPPLTAWQSLRDAAGTLVAQEQKVLVPAGWLLGLLAVASVAVVAGVRMAEQERRVGLLKAAGGTPSLVAAVLLAEHVAVALAGAGAGLAAGWAAAPLLTSPGASLVGSPGAPALTLSAAGLVVSAAVLVAAASTLVPAVRAARRSTVAALAGAVRLPRRRAWLIKVSALLPVPLLLGLRHAARRPGRFLLSAASFAVTATTVVAVLVFHATIGGDAARSGPFAGPPDPGNGRVGQVLLVITVGMGILAAATSIFTTWATVLDAQHFSAVARSAGATPQQVAAGLSAVQMLPALAGALAGIPAGTALYGAVQNGGPQGSPPTWWLAAMVLGMMLAVAGITAIPSRIGARQPVAEILQREKP